MLILLHEGAAAIVEAERDAVSRICAVAGGVAAGEAPVSHWLAERNRVPGFRGFLEKGIVLDTIEIACTWDRVAGSTSAPPRRSRRCPGCSSRARIPPTATAPAPTST